jgi:hypothetical protein
MNTGLLPIVRRVRRPLVVGTGSKGSPPPAALPKEEVPTATGGCVGEECERVVTPAPEQRAKDGGVVRRVAPTKKARE